jgi:hypothetical protein
MSQDRGRSTGTSRFVIPFGQAMRAPAQTSQTSRHRRSVSGATQIVSLRRTPGPPGTERPANHDQFLVLGEMLVVIQIFTWYIVLRNLVSDHF